MSLRTAATQAATDKKAEEQAAAAAAFEAALVKRRESLIETWAPVATEDNVVLIAPKLTVTFLYEKHERGMFATGSTWVPTTQSGSHFQVDDVDVLVWEEYASYRTETRVAVLTPCFRCENWVVVSSYGNASHIRTYYDEPEARRTELMKNIGEHIARRTLCHIHHAEKIGAACRECGRPYGDG